MSRGIFTVLSYIKAKRVYIDNSGIPVFEQMENTRLATTKDIESIYHSPEWRQHIVSKRVF